MILNSIRLVNFRQYKEPITIDFASPENKKNITLIIAANGVGKTTLLQAFRYCFYGESSNYLKLDLPSSLVNNTLADTMKELQKTEMQVKVEFSHKNEKYIAIREQMFAKQYGKLESFGKSKFKLSRLTEKEGWKEFKEAEAAEKIQSILPDGLSQVFMFDGERMERKLGDKEFSLELRESILGILNIKKYDKLIEVIGTDGRPNSVLGMLRSRFTALSDKEKDLVKRHNAFLEKSDIVKKDILRYEENLEIVRAKLEKVKDFQKQIEDNKIKVQQRDKADENHNLEQEKIERYSIDYLKLAKEALVYKLMLGYKRSYDEFIQQGEKSDLFYDSLHINTLEDILKKKICVCGRPFSEHSAEELRLNELKKHSLPLEAAQHLNLIAQKYKQTVEFDDIFNRLKAIKKNIQTSKMLMEEYKNESNKLTQDINEVTRRLGSTLDVDYEELRKKETEILAQIAVKNRDLELIQQGIDGSKSAMKKIEQSSTKNQKISKVINIVMEIKDELVKFREQKDRHAREILQNEFAKILNATLQGKYIVNIDDKYKINIIDLYTNKDVTSVLSTGQNVVISLGFINALIATAKQLSDTIDVSEKYGVIMDAALSNLDEKHIDRICKNNLVNIDQLVFLSFKRQLRDEMYRGIKSNIGKAYMLRKNESGYVIKEEVNLANLDEFIHQKEEE